MTYSRFFSCESDYIENITSDIRVEVQKEEYEFLESFFSYETLDMEHYQFSEEELKFIYDWDGFFNNYVNDRKKRGLDISRYIENGCSIEEMDPFKQYYKLMQILKILGVRLSDDDLLILIDIEHDSLI